MKQPFVSCIMPTYNRQHFIPYAIDYYLHQDYQNSELIIFDDGTEPVRFLVPDHPKIIYYHSPKRSPIGNKRNFCCEQARGDIIVHLDDDDWYASDWITKQIHSLNRSGAAITGLSDINFFLSKQNNKWEFKDTENDKPWVYGATLAYVKSFWLKNPFKEMNTGEDNEFVFRSSTDLVHHKYTTGYLGIIHRDNAGIVPYQDPREKLQLEKWIKNLDQPIVREEKHAVPAGSVNLLVTCIMPTANREVFIPSAIDNFLKQDYLNKELLIIDDGEQSIAHLVPDDARIRYFYFEPKNNTGTKRNWACERALGELIMHWDDDDWYAPDWISYQVSAFINSEADISGINQVQFYSPSQNKYWMTKNSNSHRPWLTGASLIYRKSFWEKHPFKNLLIGEDDDFVRNNQAKVIAHNYFQGFISTLHHTNTSTKFFEDPITKTIK